MTPNLELMRMARTSLKDKWGLAIGACFVFFICIVVMTMIPLVGQVASLILSGPLALGLAQFSLGIIRNEDVKIEQIFSGFKRFETSLAAYLLVLVFTLLWMLLLIIPGIIASMSYSMTFYIIADNPNISAMDAIDQSKKMMDGYKWKYFRMSLRFMGWALLCILTLGIGFFWLFPYMQVTMANFYEDVKADYKGRNMA
mgnify:FL=1